MIALIVSGCGGGGGGGGSSGSGSNSILDQNSSPITSGHSAERSVENSLPDNNALSGFIRTASDATPDVSGQVVTQSNNAGDISLSFDNTGIALTRNSVSLTGDHTNRPRVQRDANSDIYAVYALDSDQSGDGPIANAVVYATNNLDSTDYINFGYWVGSNQNGNVQSVSEIVSFATGGSVLAPIASVTHPTTEGVSATYNGRGAFNAANFSGSVVGEHGTGSVNLVANFNSNQSTIAGSFTADASIIGVLSVVVTLDEADIAAVAGGGFTGKTKAGSIETGNWGGQFYGDKAQAVAGTFSFAEDNIIAIRFVGSFGATTEDTSD